MASLAKENDRGRKGWRLRFYENGKRRSLWIGDVSKRIADAVAYNVDRLVQAKANGQRQMRLRSTGQTTSMIGFAKR